MPSLRCLVLCAALALLPATPALAQAAGHGDANLLLLEVRLGRNVLADAVTAYEIDSEIYLPLGEFARLLTLAIRTAPAAGRASGFILSEDRVFSLDIGARAVTLAGRREALDPAQLKLEQDDIYVPVRLLSHWLPVDLAVDLPSLAIEVRPRERLPLQSRFERSQRGGRSAAHNGYVDPGYARHEAPYRLAGLPFIDQTLGVAVAGGASQRRTETSYSAYLTSDLLGMQASLFAMRGPSEPSGRVRATLGRHDPDAGLLGPLRARSALIGSVPVPGVQNVSLTSSAGNGAMVSNRPLNQPTRFDQHTLQGDLPPGWEVELYYNEALVGFQQSGPDGRYHFPDLPLAYGPNDFRLVFHGPFGQLRVERHSFLLEQSAVAPGALYYSAARHRDRDGHDRSLAQFEWGLTSFMSATGALARLPVGGYDQRFTHLGLHAYWQSFILSGEAARSGDGGRLVQVGVKTRLGKLALSATRARLDGFSSEIFQPALDPVASRDEVRIDGALLDPFAALPVSLHARRDTLASGIENTQVQGRISAYRSGMAISNALRWQSAARRKLVDGVLQASRRVAGVGLNGQLDYTISPHARLGAAALSLDTYLADGVVANLGLTRSFANASYRLSGALNKSLGSFGLGLSGFYTSRHEYGAAIQLFMALGIEPRQGRVLRAAQPMANTGAASLRVFFDRNLNGVMDQDDEPVPGAGFTVNGGNQLVRTDASGLAYLGRLPSHQHLDIGLDPDTLEDPQWRPQVKGVRLVPRPGTVSQVDFALSVTGEIDGTTYLLADGVQKPIGDLDLELVGHDRKVAATVRSSADGYYVLAGIFPGSYLLRVSPAQLQRLGMSDTGSHLVEIGPEGSLLNARDFVIVAGGH